MYYPDQRYASPLTIIRRECRLPEEASGSVKLKVSAGERVDVRDIVATGSRPAPYIIIEAARFFGLRRPQDLDKLVRMNLGDRVEAGQVIAGKSLTRGKRLYSPVTGYIAYIGDGRIIMQEMAETISLEAGVRGRVAAIEEGRGVSIDAVGAQIQGVWGNDRNVIATLEMMPEAGIQAITSNSLETRFSGAMLVTRNPLTAEMVQAIAEQDFAGIIAPSMDATLLEAVLALRGAVILIDGFGDMRMSAAIYNLLESFAGHQATVDANQPNRWESRYPEVIINLPANTEERPSRPSGLLALRPGMSVRVTREPHLGATGRVTKIPKNPTRLPNGLRLPCAQVELVIGETVFVPLANLELLGR